MNASYQRGDEVLLVGGGRPQPARRPGGLDQLAELEEPGVLADLAPPPGRGASSSQKIRTAGSAPLAAGPARRGRAATRASMPGCRVGHRQQEQRVAPKVAVRIASADDLVAVEHRRRTSTAPRRATAMPASRSPGSARRRVATTVLRTGSLGEVLAGDVEERGRVVEETQLHAATLGGAGRPDTDCAGRDAGRPDEENAEQIGRPSLGANYSAFSAVKGPHRTRFRPRPPVHRLRP